MTYPWLLIIFGNEGKPPENTDAYLWKPARDAEILIEIKGDRVKRDNAMRRKCIMKSSVWRTCLCVIGMISFVFAAGIVHGEDYTGTWIRQKIFTQGAEVASKPATLSLTADSFKSFTERCNVSGRLQVSGNNMTMITKTTTCPNHTPETVTKFTYEVSNGGQKMTLRIVHAGIEVKEVYRRK